MNTAEKLIIQIEVQEYLKEQSKRIGKDLKEAFPGIKNAHVNIYIWFGPLEKKVS